MPAEPRSYDMAPATDNGNCLPKFQAAVKSLPGIGHLIYLTDFGQQNCKWVGEVAEIKRAATTEITVVIKVSLQPVKG